MQETSTHYTVLARRFRPQTFAEVVGQRHVAQALTNAIKTGRVAHAYLFTGARGVGKTSMARILAKALNCPNARDGIPCNECEICQGVSSGHDVDVQEIDGASNRGIDDIRSLRANVNVKSMRTRHKVYIIDEVHMLTKEAFNALLKTLEEPPPNVKFVFCTTEPTKVPDTILSRCQRFDFTTIETANIIGRLEQIAAAEGYEVEPAALELVARRAAGSMRDSQSLFDQLLAFGGEKITVDDVHRLFGTASDERLISLVDALAGRRPDEALGQFDRALSEGVQLGELVDQLLAYFRDLMVLASRAESVPLLGVSQESRAVLSQQAEAWGLRTIVAGLEVLTETKTRMFRASFARALAELALVRISLLEDLERLSELISDLKRSGNGATRSAQGSTPAPAGGSLSSGPSSQGRRADPAPPVGRAPQKKSSEEAPLTQSGPAVAWSRDQTVGGATIRPSEVMPAGESGTEASPEVSQRVAPNDLVADAPVADSPAIEFQPGRESEIWAQVVSQIHDMLKTHAAAVQQLAISGPNRLELFFPPNYHFSKQYCERPEVVGRLERLVEQVTGRPVRISLRLGPGDTAANGPGRGAEVDPDGMAAPAAVADRAGGAAADGVVPAAERDSERTAAAATARPLSEAQQDPYVKQALSVFGGTIVKIEGISAAASAHEE